ncbi:MAG: hypothetical protein ACJZZ9_05710 [Cytophagales bacterium]
MPSPLKVTIDELKSGDFQSILVEVEDIQFVTDDVNKAVTGTRTITDCSSKLRDLYKIKCCFC